LAKGFVPRIAGGTADDLVAVIHASGERGPFVHFRGREALGDVAARLASHGIPCAEVVVYAQEAVPLTDEALALLARPGAVLLPLFSPQSARRLANAIEGHPVRAHLNIIAMSPTVAEAWNGPEPARVLIAERPDGQAMIAALRTAAALP
jgi:uroporphyrinogen-III synthase